MKRLGLLRHAKSDWDDPALDDFDRPLSDRGRKAATRMGEEMRTLDLHFDLALVSPARRAADTFERLRGAWGAQMESRFEPRLYLASAADILAIAAHVGQGADQLLIVGHNPGLHELAALLVASDGSQERRLLAAKFPTGALAEISLATESWPQAGEGEGTLLRFLRPRDLE